jgi:hypothetical protein
MTSAKWKKIATVYHSSGFSNPSPILRAPPDTPKSVGCHTSLPFHSSQRSSATWTRTSGVAAGVGARAKLGAAGGWSAGAQAAETRRQLEG